jgi:hypothetical protein
MPYNKDEVEKAKKIANILKIVAKKIVENPNILGDLNLATEDIPRFEQKKKEDNLLINFNIYAVFSDGGETVLREKLESFDIVTLKQIISRNSLDSSGLSRKWRKKDKIINLIVEKVAARSEKGHAFSQNNRP